MTVNVMLITINNQLVVLIVQKLTQTYVKEDICMCRIETNVWKYVEMDGEFNLIVMMGT